MPDRVRFSNQHPDIQQLARYYNDAAKSLRLYFSPAAPSFSIRFANYKPDEIDTEMKKSLHELEMATILSLFSAIEAAFRIDYLQRCYRKEKDAMSREFRDLHKKKGPRVPLEDLLETWKKHAFGPTPMIGKLRAALHFRHWLAHGRYWSPRFPTSYDYLAVYSLAETVRDSFKLLRPEA